jgi:hypothetical protein
MMWARHGWEESEPLIVEPVLVEPFRDLIARDWVARIRDEFSSTLEATAAIAFGFSR